MEGNTLKTTTSDRSPRRSRTKSLLGVLTATALLAGATQALAPASASAMSDQDNEAGAVCNQMVLEWLGICYTEADSAGGSSSGPSSSSGSSSSPGGGDSRGGGGGASTGSSGGKSTGPERLPVGSPPSGYAECWGAINRVDNGEDAWICLRDPGDVQGEEKRKRADRRRDRDSERGGARRSGGRSRGGHKGSQD
jgi:hypothetical protein